MANYDSKNLVVQMKVFSRTEPLPIDATEIWDNLADAQSYIKEANAYAGQTIKAKLNDGKYHTYTIQPSETGYVLEELNSSISMKQYVIVVDKLPSTQQEQGVLYINKTDSTGYIWNGSGWQIIFKDISSDFDKTKDRIKNLESEIKTKAPINNPIFTGKVMIGQNEVAVKSYVDELISNISTMAPGVVDDTHPLPVSNYKAGQTWRVAKSGVYAANKCETGDLIICIKSYTGTASNSDFMVVQANIEGAVTSNASNSIKGDITVFDSSTGKIINSSGVNISSLKNVISKAHEHTNKSLLDTYTKDQASLLQTAKSEAQTLVDNFKNTVDSKIDTKVNVAKQELTTNFTQILSARIGDIPAKETVKAYVDRVVGSGGTDVSGAIENAKQAAIAESKNYTNSCLTITEF